jgi:pyrimidine operon attenuation protein/uracil phosphoribosyltransferase
VGQTLATERDDDVQVLLAEVDDRDAVLVRRAETT